MFPWEHEREQAAQAEAAAQEEAAAQKQETVKLPDPGTIAFLADGTPCLILGAVEEKRQGGTDRDAVPLDQAEVAILSTQVVEVTQLHSQRPAPAADTTT